MKLGQYFAKLRAKAKKHRAIKQGLKPHKLPSGMAEFESFVQKIFTTYDFPDLPSYRETIASMIMHLQPQVHEAPLSYFEVSIKKAQANETCFFVLQELKRKAKEEAMSEQSAANAKTVLSVVDPVVTQ